VIAQDLQVGMELPELVKTATTRQLVQYAGASGDFYEIHYDQDFARSTGLPGVILHGLLKAAFLGQLVTDWAGDRGRLESLEVSYRGLDLPAQPCRCRGLVTAVDGNRVELEIWSENPDGQKTTVGTAVVLLDASLSPA
jgi:hydroxyacyl-ACP dehydratase HTD2-like protein with hotdog domain